MLRFWLVGRRIGERWGLDGFYTHTPDGGAAACREGLAGPYSRHKSRGMGSRGAKRFGGTLRDCAVRKQ